MSPVAVLPGDGSFADGIYINTKKKFVFAENISTGAL